VRHHDEVVILCRIEPHHDEIFVLRYLERHHDGAIVIVTRARRHRVARDGCAVFARARALVDAYSGD